MAYTVQAVTTVDLEVLRRLFDECESNLDEGTYPFASGLTSGEKFSVLAQDFQHYAEEHLVVEVRKDGYEVAAITGKAEGDNCKLILMLAGRDLEASRAYLYDPDFAQALAGFFRNSGFASTTKKLTKDKPMSTYNNTIWPTAGCASLTGEEDSVDAVGNTYESWRSVL